jgi:hypothetical protein
MLSNRPWRRSAHRRPGDAEARIRTLFLYFFLLSSVSAVVQTIRSEVATHKLVAVAAIVWIVGSVLWLYERQRPLFAMDVLDCVAL